MLSHKTHAAIAAELRRHPDLPDTVIAERLQARGIAVSRATVWRVRHGYHPAHLHRGAK